MNSPDAQAHVTIKVLNALLDLLVRELLDVARELDHGLKSEFQHTRHHAKSANGRLSAAATNGTEGSVRGNTYRIAVAQLPAPPARQRLQHAARWLFDDCCHQDHLNCRIQV